MKKIINILIIVLFVTNVIAQNDRGTIDDFGRIALTPTLSSDTDMPRSAQKILLSKLKQIATKNGFGSTDNNQFLITSTVDVLDKQLTETAPPMVSYSLNVNFYIVDYKSKNIVSSTSQEFKGVGKNDNKAYLSALKRISPTSSKIRSFVKKGKNKIIEYYNTECEVIIKQAQTLANTDNDKEAIDMLLSVPTVCKECHYKALKEVENIYKKMIGDDCKINLDSAKVAFENEDIEKAKNYLESIEPGTDCYDKAVNLSKKINKKKLKKSADEDKIKMKEIKELSDEEKLKMYKEATQKESEKSEEVEYDLDFVGEE